MKRRVQTNKEKPKHWKYMDYQNSSRRASFWKRIQRLQRFCWQGLVLAVQYKVPLERWVSPDGQSFIGKLPAELGQPFQCRCKKIHPLSVLWCHVTQPILLTELLDIGIDISSGQLNNIIIEGHAPFHAEKDSILNAGLAVSSYVNVDDTSARHKGKNGYCPMSETSFLQPFIVQTAKTG